MSYFVGSVKDDDLGKGWFYGHFGKKTRHSKDVEVAWQTIGIRPEQDHYHKVATEITVVVAGGFMLNIDDEPHVLNRGDFMILEPGTKVSNVRGGAEIVVIKTPSVPDDKYPV